MISESYKAQHKRHGTLTGSSLSNYSSETSRFGLKTSGHVTMHSFLLTRAPPCGQKEYCTALPHYLVSSLTLRHRRENILSTNAQCVPECTASALMKSLNPKIF